MLLFRDVVAWHRNTELISFGFDLGVDFLELCSCGFGFWLSSFNCVLEFVESLANWIGVAYIRVIYECNILDSPSNKVSSELTAKGTCSEQQAFLTLNLRYIKRGQQSPLH